MKHGPFCRAARRAFGPLMTVWTGYLVVPVCGFLLELPAVPFLVYLLTHYLHLLLPTLALSPFLSNDGLE